MHESAPNIMPLMPSSGANLIESNKKEESEIPTMPQNREIGIATLESNALEASPQTAIATLHNETSTEQLLSYEEAKLASTSLCDEVIERLHWQLKRHSLRGDQNTQVEIAGHNEIARSKIVIGTASEIGKMIRLKLDAVKMFHEIKNS